MKSIFAFILTFASLLSGAQALKLGLPVGHTAAINKLVFSPDNSSLLSCSEDGTAKVWDMSTGKLLFDLKGHSSKVIDASFDSAGSKILTLSEDQSIRLWDSKTGRQLYSYSSEESIIGAGFNGSGDKILIAGYQLIVINLRNGYVLKPIELESDVQSLAFSPDRKKAVITSQNYVFLYDFVAEKLTHSISVSGFDLSHAEFTSNPNLLLLTTYDNDFRVLDIADKKVIRKSEREYDFYIQLTGRNKILFSNGPDLWWTNVDSLAQSQQFYTHPEYIDRFWKTPLSGQVILSCNSTLAVFALDSNKVLKEFRANTKLNSVCLSNNGNRLAASDQNHIIHIWDFRSGEEQFQIRGSGTINSAIFSPGHETFLTTSNNNSVKIWDSKTGTLLRTLTGHRDVITAAIYSPDGKQVVSGSKDKKVIVWDLKSGRKVAELKEHSADIRRIYWNTDRKQLITIAGNYSVIFWDTDSFKAVNKFYARNDVRSLSYTKDSLFVLLHTYYGYAVWSPATNRSIAFIDGNTLPDSIGADETIYLTVKEKSRWQSTIIYPSYSSKSPSLEVRGNADTITAIRYHQGRGEIKCTRLLRTSETLQKQRENVYQYNFNYSPDGKYIAADYSDHSVRLFDSRSEKEIIRLIGHKAYILNFSFNRSSDTLVTSSLDGEIRLWELETGKEITRFNHGKNLNGAGFTAHNGLILSVGNKEIKSWNAKGQLLNTIKLKKRIKVSALSKDGSHLAIVNNKNVLSLYRLADGTKLFQVYAGPWINSVSMSPDGKFIMTSSDQLIKMWDVKDGHLIKCFACGQFTYVLAAELSPDGKSVLSYGDSVRLWNVDGQLIRSFGYMGQISGFLRIPSSILTAQFSPDGSKILAADDASLFVWDVESGALLFTYSISNYEQLYFSPDSRTIMLESGSEFYQIDAETGEERLLSRDTDKRFAYRILPASGGSIVLKDTNERQVLQHFIFDNGYVSLSPEGFFDASPEAMNNLYWLKGNEVIEFSQLKDRFWIPGLWEKIMKGESLPQTLGLKDVKLNPLEKIDSISNGKVYITLRKRDGGYGPVTFLINGKEVSGDVRGSAFNPSAEVQHLTVDLNEHPLLKEGHNEIMIRAAAGEGGIQGKGASSSYYIQAVETKPVRFYAIIAGVGSYNNPAINLKFPVSDAKSVSVAMQLAASNLFGKENVYINTITSDTKPGPGKEVIKKAFEDVAAKASSNDIILVYLSGHGITWGEENADFYFLTSEATAADKSSFSDKVLREKHAISTFELTEWLKKIPALKQVMIIDACGSGKAVENLIAARDVDGNQKKAIDRMQDRTGMFIISGCAADAVSYEASRFGQGLLTYSILQAMKGAALKQDQYVDVQSIFSYARDMVPQLAEELGGIQKPQLLLSRNGSFDIGILSLESRAQIPLSNPKKIYVRSNLVEAESYEDLLGLSKSVDSLLANSDAASSIIFFDSREYPGAYRISGAYQVGPKGISLNAKLRYGTKVQELKITAKNREELLAELKRRLQTIEMN